MEECGRRIVSGQTGYADVLVLLMPGTVLATTEAEAQGLRLELIGGSIVVLPTQEEVVGSEIAMLFGFTDKHRMCGLPGGEAFEHLT